MKLWILRSAGRIDETRVKIEETIEKEPDFPLAYMGNPELDTTRLSEL
jgi:hypothetical protein